jgi:hypothetical protein
MDALRSYACGEGWRDVVRRAGGEPMGEPVLSLEPNPSYGLVLTGENGDLVLNEETGEPVVDRTRFLLMARGWATRGDSS